MGVSRDYEQAGTVLRFDSQGQLVGQFEGSGYFALGRLNDAFTAGQGLRRTNRESGVLLWSKATEPGSQPLDVFTDEAGSPYFAYWNDNKTFLEKRAVSSGERIWRQEVSLPIFIDGPEFLGWVKSSNQWVMARISKKYGTVVQSFPETTSSQPQSGDGKGSEAFFYKHGPYSKGLWFYKDGSARELGRIANANLGKIYAVGDETCLVASSEVTRYGNRFNRIWQTPIPIHFKDLSISSGKIHLLTQSFTSSLIELDLASGEVSSTTSVQHRPTVIASRAGKVWLGGDAMPDSTAAVEMLSTDTMAQVAFWKDAYRSATILEPFAFEMAGSSEPLIGIASYDLARLVRLRADGSVRWTANLAERAYPSYDSVVRLSISSDKKTALVAFQRAGFRRTDPSAPFSVKLNLGTGAIEQVLPGMAFFIPGGEVRSNELGSSCFNADGSFRWSCNAQSISIPAVDSAGNVYLADKWGMVTKVGGIDGTILWQISSNSFMGAQIAIAGSLAIVTDGRTNSGLAINQTTPLWSRYTGAYPFQGWTQVRLALAPEGLYLSDASGEHLLINPSTGESQSVLPSFTTANGTRYYLGDYEGNMFKKVPGQAPQYFGQVRDPRMFAWDAQKAFILSPIWQDLKAFSLTKATL